MFDDDDIFDDEDDGDFDDDRDDEFFEIMLMEDEFMAMEEEERLEEERAREDERARYDPEYARWLYAQREREARTGRIFTWVLLGIFLVVVLVILTGSCGG